MFKRLRGLKTLVFDAVEETTNLVQDSHESVSSKTMDYLNLLEPVAGAAKTVNDIQRLTAAGVYTAIRTVNRGIDKVTDAGYVAAMTLVLDLKSPTTIYPW